MIRRVEIPRGSLRLKGCLQDRPVREYATNLVPERHTLINYERSSFVPPVTVD